MKDVETALTEDLSDLNTQEWMQAIATIANARGSWIEISDQHDAAMVGRGDTLLVTFESVADIQEKTDMGHPLGFSMSQTLDCANLMILAQDQTWFRDPALFAFFDGLIDEGVFEEYSNVLVYGAGMCGYAAAAFSVSCPGAQVIVVHPQATLDPRVAEWDHRYPSMRRTSFTDRYGYAPEMVEAVNEAFVLYDPEEEVDAMHAALFTKPNVTKLRCRFMGLGLDAHLAEMGVLKDLFRAAIDRTLTPQSFGKIYRARRDYASYLLALLRRLEDDDRSRMMAWMCINGLKRKNMPRLRKKLEQLAKDGVPEAKAHVDAKVDQDA